MVKKNILIIGGSGYIGSHIISSLSNNYNFINISRDTVNKQASNNIIVNIKDGLDFLRFSCNIELIINCCDITDCGKDIKNERCYADVMQKLTSFAKKINVKKIIHFSNYIEQKEYLDKYIQSKIISDRVIEHSGIDFIIFRSTLIFGNNSILDTILKKLSSLKILSSDIANRLFAPVYIDDVIRNVAYAMQNSDCWNSNYIIHGPEQMKIIEAINRYALKKPSVLNIPTIFSKIHIRSTLDKELINFYKRHIDIKTSAINCKYPQLIKSLKFY